MSERLNQQLAATAAAESEAEQKRLEYREVRMSVIRPTVVEYIKNEREDLDLEANIGVICNRLVDQNRQPTEANIRAAIAQGGVQPKVLSEAEQREALETKLKEEGASSTLIAKFASMSTEQLQAKLEELKNLRRWQGMSHAELQAEAQAERQVPPGVVPVAPGTPILSPSITRHVFSRYSTEELHKLIRSMDQKHGLGAGDVAVSARLSGADANEIKRIYGIGE